jgi:hypothetical protein
MPLSSVAWTVEPDQFKVSSWKRRMLLTASFEVQTTGKPVVTGRLAAEESHAEQYSVSP